MLADSEALLMLIQMHLCLLTQSAMRSGLLTLIQMLIILAPDSEKRGDA